MEVCRKSLPLEMAEQQPLTLTLSQPPSPALQAAAPQPGVPARGSLVADSGACCVPCGACGGLQLRYGVCAGDLDADGRLEFFVCGFGSRNRLLKVSSSPAHLRPATLR